MKSEPLNPELLNMFAHEVVDRSSDIENIVLTLEQTGDPADAAELQKQLLKTVHSLKGAAGLMQIRSVESLCHWMEEMLSAPVRTQGLIEKQKLDLFLAAADRFREVAPSLKHPGLIAADEDQDLLEAMKLAAQEPGQTRSDRPAVQGMPKLRRSDMDGSMRVSATQLDSLLYRSGELLTLNHVLRHQIEKVVSLREQTRRARGQGAGSGGDMEKVERGLRDLATSLRQSVGQIQSASNALHRDVRDARTKPFSEACKGLPRMVRDMSAALGKSAQIEIDGADIEVDRSILSNLQDALRHLVRNAIDHGIEMPEKRRAAGKAETGKIRISATAPGDRLQVRVEDDGRGIDVSRLRDAAGETATGPTHLQDIFKPGFSTSTTVTHVSGRGMGLDIVKAAVERLRGTVEVSQELTRGATFVLTLPLTVSTIRVLEITSAGHVFTLDTASVLHVVSFRPEDLAAGSSIVTDSGKIPIVDLARWLGILQAKRSAAMRAVVIGAAGTQVAVLVDDILGERELLARTLSPRLAKIRYYCGAMVLPDGRIAPLLNPAAIAEAAIEPLPVETSITRIGLASKPARVLVVDDSKVVQSLIRLIVEKAGYEVMVAEDGAEALRQLAEQPADIVISDIDMPKMDGLALLEAIRRSDQFANLPVILITGRESEEDRSKGLEAGATAYLNKDRFDTQEFLETMRRVV